MKKDDINAEIHFWQEHFLDGSSSRKAFYEPLQYLWSTRVSEAACERGYSASSLVTEGRPGLSSSKASHLTHLYWGTHCFDTAPPPQNLRLLRKRKHLGDDLVEVVSSDEDNEGCDEVLAELEQALEVTIPDEGLDPSPHEALALLAFGSLAKLHDHIKVEDGAALLGAISVAPVFVELKKAIVCQMHMKKNKVFADIIKTVKKYQVGHDDPIIRMTAGQLLTAWKETFRNSASVHSCADDALKA